MVSIPACHAGDPSSILGLGAFYSVKKKNNLFNKKFHLYKKKILIIDKIADVIKNNGKQ